MARDDFHHLPKMNDCFLDYNRELYRSPKNHTIWKLPNPRWNALEEIYWPQRQCILCMDVNITSRVFLKGKMGQGSSDADAGVGNDDGGGWRERRWFNCIELLLRFDDSYNQEWIMHSIIVPFYEGGNLLIIWLPLQDHLLEGTYNIYTSLCTRAMHRLCLRYDNIKWV